MRNFSQIMSVVGGLRENGGRFSLEGLCFRMKNLSWVTFLCYIVCLIIFTSSSVTSANNEVCNILAATSIDTINWECTVAGVAVTDPCNWPSVACEVGQIVSLDFSGNSLTGMCCI
jgi:hypothetical protein